MYNVDRKLLPSHLVKTFYQNNEIHCYYTRPSNNYHIESVNTNVKQFSIKYKGADFVEFHPSINTFT